MSEDNLNKIASLEKSISKKYCVEAIQNPKSFWDPEKEKKYLKELEKFYEYRDKKTTRKKTGNITITVSTAKKEGDPRVCPVCGTYSLTSRDDLYMTKFETCYKCYIQHIEGREERWKSGWRPNN